MAIYEHNQRDVKGQWDLILNDMTDNAGEVFLGLSVTAALAATTTSSIRFCRRSRGHSCSACRDRGTCRPRRSRPVILLRGETCHVSRAIALLMN